MSCFFVGKRSSPALIFFYFVILAQTKVLLHEVFGSRCCGLYLFKFGRLAFKHHTAQHIAFCYIVIRHGSLPGAAFDTTLFCAGWLCWWNNVALISICLWSLFRIADINRSQCHHNRGTFRHTLLTLCLTLCPTFFVALNLCRTCFLFFA